MYKKEKNVSLVSVPPGWAGTKPANKKVSGVVIMSEAKNLLK
jgi:hypothetical protein